MSAYMNNRMFGGVTGTFFNRASGVRTSRSSVVMASSALSCPSFFILFMAIGPCIASLMQSGAEPIISITVRW